MQYICNAKMIVVNFNTFNFFLICSRLFYLEPSFEYVLQLILIKRFFFFCFDIRIRCNLKFIERISLFNFEVDLFSGNVSSKIVYFTFSIYI